MSSAGDTSPNLFTRLAHRARHNGDSAAFEASVLAVARRYDLSVEQIKTATNRPLAPSRARQTAIYLCHTHFGVSQLSISRITGLDPAGIRRACGAVEDRRICADFDRALDELELELIVCT
jgi:chromosomal replication initiation ATPase DnaA